MIIAVDFDGTLCDDKYPRIGSPHMSLIDLLIKRRCLGDKIILWTCRSGEKLQDAIYYCEAYGLHFDAVNENLPEIIEQYGSDSRKITADVYVDDRHASEMQMLKLLG